MKVIFLTLIALSLTLISFSQLTKNNWLVGGTGKFYTYSSAYSSDTYNNKGKFTEFDISANVGYFVADKVAFGLRPGFSSIKGEITTPGGARANTRKYGAGPFGRFYFLSVDKPHNILIDLSYQYGISTLNNKKIGNFNDFSAMAGPAIYFNNCIAIEFLLGYNSSLVSNDQAFEEEHKGFQVSVGFQIHLEK